MQNFVIGVIILVCLIWMVKWALIAVAALAAICLTLFFLYGVYAGLRHFYHMFNPSAREAFLERRERQKAVDYAARRQQEKQKRANRQAQAAAARADRKARVDAARSAHEEEERRERARQCHRDADFQDTPYTYEIGRHANEALAIRYGIANQKRKIEEYHYFAKGGVRMRNSSRDRVYWVPSDTINIRKLRSLRNDLFLAALPDHGDRKVRVVIERGTEYVKTFLPIDDEWFKTHRKLEETLKHNKSFTLKELASFHVQKTV